MSRRKPYQVSSTEYVGIVDYSGCVTLTKIGSLELAKALYKSGNLKKLYKIANDEYNEVEIPLKELNKKWNLRKP